MARSVSRSRAQYLLGGGNYARFTLPADAQTLLDNVAISDRFIFKAARPAATTVRTGSGTSIEGEGSLGEATGQAVAVTVTRTGSGTSIAAEGSLGEATGEAAAVIPSSGHEQTLDLPSAWYSTNANGVYWIPPEGSRPEIDAELTHVGYGGAPSNGLMFFTERQILISSNSMSPTHKPRAAQVDLSEEFEANGTLTVTIGSLIVNRRTRRR